MSLTRTLASGMTGKDVAILQQALRAMNIPVQDPDGHFRDGTRRAVIDFQRRNRLRATGSFSAQDLERLIKVLDEDPFRRPDEADRTDPEKPEPEQPDPDQPAPARFSLLVTGLVLQPDGKPISGAVVAGVSKGIIAAQDADIARARTDAEGRYTFKAGVPDGGIDLVVEVRARRGSTRITRSPLIIGAIDTRTVDLIVNDPNTYPRQSEFEQLRQRLEPLLERIEDPAALDTDAIAVLHAKTGLSPIRIAHFLKAADFARRDNAVDAEIYYGLFRANLPANGPALAALEDGLLARAIRTASEAGVINSKIARGRGKIDAVVSAVNAAEIDTILTQPDLKNGTASMATFLDIARLRPQGRRSFVALVESHTGSSAEFWKKLREDQSIGEAGRRRLETTVRLSVLTLGNTPLMRVLSERLANVRGDDPLRSLVSLTRGDWQGIIEGLNGGGLPPGFVVSGGQKPAPVYARMMARMIEDAYPTPSLAARLGKEDFDGAVNVARFLGANPGFDLATQSLRAFAAENGLAIDAVTRRAGEGVQRVFALAPRFERYEIMQPLLARGITSAYQIRSMGETQWLQAFSGPLGETQARMVFENAQARTALATTLIGRYSANFNNVGMNVLPAWDVPAIIGELSGNFPTVDEATWESLFGNIDFCACEHCNSVYSPAAYMVALLKFLRDRGLLGEFSSRRAEIGELHLTCDNTNIVLPYIDLVIEALEGFLTDTPVAHATTGEVRDLRVHPEHINHAAYTLLEAEVYPWELPFSLWTEEARSYLGPLDTNRTELLDVFNPTPWLERTLTERTAVAIEHLGLTLAERDLILDGTFTAAHWDNVSLNSLRTVQTLLDTARIEFYELLQLLDSRFVNPAGSLQIQYAVGEEEDAQVVCDLSLARIEALSNTNLNRIERFTRLRRKLGWSVHELDVALAATAGAIAPSAAVPLDEDALVPLSDIKWLHEQFETDILVLASWIADIDIRAWLGEGDDTRVSTYASLFLNRTIGSAEDLAPLELAALGVEDLGDHEAAILAALRIITAEELSLIRERRLADSVLTLANLSELHRFATMKRALGLSVRELLDLLELAGLDPFSPATLGKTRRVKELLDLIEGAGFNIAELTYLCRDTFEPPAAFVPAESQIAVFLHSLRTGLAQVRETYRVEPDQTGEVTGQLLASVVAAAELPGVIASIDFSADPTELPVDPAATLDNAFGDFLPAVTARSALIAQLVDDTDPGFLTPEVQRAARFALVLQPLARYLERTASIALVKSSFAELLSLEIGATDQLLSLMASTANPADPASAPFLDPLFAEAGDTIDAATYPDQFGIIRRLLKAALVVSRLQIPTDDLADLFATVATFNWLDFDALPLAAAPGTAAFDAWVNTANLYAMNDRAPAGETSLLPLLIQANAGGDAAAFNQFLDKLHSRLRWPRAEIDAFVAATHFDLDDFNADWQGEDALANLRCLEDAFRLLQKLGVAPDMAWGWSGSAVDRFVASEVKQAARAKYQPNQWYDVAEPVRDRLRKQQRDALVEAAIRQLNSSAIQDSEDLYNHFLMDVAMQPCFQTSRIVFATGAIQTFVQRVLMNLEDGVSLSNADAEQWKWMKNYRVWEANVKVFVTPENWIEPELRIEKSPFFKALEDELLQGDVTLETVELAYQGYLEKLDEVARLEVTGLWRENDTMTLHVIGRTKGKPNKYFYRRWEEARRWTPWEEIPLEIEAECVTPVIYNRRLYIFWLMTTEMADEEVPSGSGSGSQPNRYLEIKLAWSQYRQRKWVGNRLTDFGLYTQRTRDTSWQRIIPHAWRPRPIIKPDGDLLIALEYSANAWGPTRLNPSQLAGDTGFLFVNDSQIESEDYSGEINLELARPANYCNSRSFFYSTSRFSPELKMRGYNGSMQSVLGETPTPWRLTTPLQSTQYNSSMPFIFEDRYRSYFVIPRHVFGYIPSFQGDLTIDINPGVFMELDEPVRVDDLDLTDIIGPLPDPAPEFGPELMPLGGDNPALAALSLIGGSSTDPGDIGSRVASARRVTGASQPLLVHDMTAPVLGGDVDLVFDTVRGDFNGTASQPLALLARSDGADASPAMMLLRSDSGTDNYTIRAAEMAVADNVMVTANNPGIWATIWQQYLFTRYRFVPFYHPYMPKLVKQLNRQGVEGILNPREGGPEDDLRRQQTREAANRQFDDIYGVGQRLDSSRLPVEQFDFEYGSPLAIYNWELFFHIPFMIATHLSRSLRFEDAQKWYHFIFDPTDNSDVPALMNPYRFWKIKPFYENTDIRTVEEMLRLLSSSDAADLETRRDLEAQIKDWRKNPFQPHRIAEQRPVAYQKSVVMKYLDNLIAWADHLFRQDTRESVREAMQIYVLASGILGKEPQRIPAPEGVKTIGGNPVRSFNDLAPHLNDLDNALIMLETVLPPAEVPGSDPGAGLGAADSFLNPGGEGEGGGITGPGDIVSNEPEDPLAPEIVGSTLFFCVPPNPKLLSYWDIVADRLFKIRHCLNIEGVERQLALFAPPIDPALLVRATAAGVDLSSVLSDLSAPRPHYRFQTMLRSALDLCADVKALGQALLSALEKRDAEDLSLLRQRHEEALLKAVRAVRKRQIDEAKEAITGLKKNLEGIEQRQAFYDNREARIPNERLHLQKLESAQVFETISSTISAIGSALSMIPEFDIGAEGGFSSPTVKAQFGGANLSKAASIAAQILSITASIERQDAQRASIVAGYDRRQEEWDFSAAQATKDAEHMESQIAGAEVRLAIAEKELENQELQIEHSQETHRFMRDKFTNRDLYSWMVGQVSGLHFQSYQLAYDLAKRAERAFQHELADPDASHINFGYWDSLRKGLLAGERLQLDLRRMETAYREQNRREYEITRHCSLAQIDPAALIQLRQTGRCEFEVPEAFFNLDHPSHYLRRIKSVGLTVPCVTGPYSGVNATLALLQNRVRVNPTNADQPYTGPADGNFIVNTGGIQSVAISSGRDDTGLFQLSYQDERYLPFEGAGAISRWRISLADPYRGFDYDSISDIVLKIAYTAREGGQAVATPVIVALDARLDEIINATATTGLYRLFQLRRDLGTTLFHFLNPAGAADHSSGFALSPDLLPYVFRGKTITIDNVMLLLELTDPTLYENGSPLAITLQRGAGAVQAADLLMAGTAFGGLPHAEFANTTGELDTEETWTISVPPAAVQALPAGLRTSVDVGGSNVPRIRGDLVTDVALLVHYTVG